MISETVKQIEKFITEKKSTTEKREKLFNLLFSFVFDGQQWTENEIKERLADDKEILAFNFSQDYVNRYMAKLFPRSPRTGIMEVGAKVYNDNDGKFNDKIMSAYRRNYLPAILLEQGKNFLVGGAACFIFPQNAITKKTEIFSVDPKSCFLNFQFGELVQFAYVKKLTKDKRRIQYFDKTEIISVDENNKVERQKNILGFLPVAWIPNDPKPHTQEGIPMIMNLYDLDRAYNARMCDFSDRVEENTEPHMVVFSDKGKKENYERGKKKISLVGKDDDVRYLELKETAEVINFASSIDKKMARKTGLVDNAGGIKSVVSGLSLQFQYSDMNDMIGFMRIYWDRAFRDLNQAILKYEIGLAEYETDPSYHPSIMFDSKQRVEEYEIMLRNKIISRRDAIDELRGVENADEKIDQILEEEKLFNVVKPEPTGKGNENQTNKNVPKEPKID